MTFKVSQNFQSLALEAFKDGNWQAAYGAILRGISNDSLDAPKEGVNLAVWTWVKGAKEVNGNNGVFGQYIRDYTAAQYKLRSGEEMPIPKLQAASDQIALNFVADVLNLDEAAKINRTLAKLNPNSGFLPDLHTIGGYDAAGAASQVFNDIASSTGLPNYSPWAGTVLFTNLGDNSFFNNWIAQQGTSFNKQESGTYDLITAARVSIQLKNLWSAIESLGQAGTLIKLKELGDASKDQAIAAANNFLDISYGYSSNKINIGNSIFHDLVGTVEAGKKYIVGTIYNDDGDSHPALEANTSSSIVHAGTGDDKILVKSHSYNFGYRIIDGGEGKDTLDYSAISRPLYISADAVGSYGGRIIAQVDAKNDAINRDVIVNVERLIFGKGNDYVTINQSLMNKLEKLDTGAGNDTVNITGRTPLEIRLGTGNDTLEGAPEGSVVYGGTGADVFYTGKDYLIADADKNDQIVYGGGMVLTGGIRYSTSESPWAAGYGGVRYAVNTDGELVIQDKEGRDTYVNKFNQDTSGSNRTGGILLGELHLGFTRLMDAPKGFIYDTFATLFGPVMKALTGQSYFKGVDPLVLDLDGDGIELDARLGFSPKYDIDGDGFAEQSGWAYRDDGFLVRDLNANGKIDSVKEMFGNEQQDGFAALRTLDSNKDGTITSADAAFTTLSIWQDKDGDRVTDAGELKTLAQWGISSIKLTPTSTALQTVAGNDITAIGSFTRNGTTQTIGNVAFDVNQRDTTWLGDKTIDAASKALPELKGFGTLTDLRIAMTDSAALKAAMQAALPNLNTPNLATLRGVVAPVLSQWTKALPAPEGAAGSAAHVDVAIRAGTDSSGTHVYDFAYRVTDAGGTYWKLASGAAVLNGSGVVIAKPTYAQVLAQKSTEGAWTTFSGEQIQFVERYTGTPMPVGLNNLSGAESVSAAGQLLDFMWGQLNNVAVRLAVQGPLASYFPGIRYNGTTDQFEATTDRQLVPTFEALFKAAPKTDSGATAHLASWKAFIDTFLHNFDRGADYLQVSYAYLFQNLVAAYENVGLSTSLVKAAGAFTIPADIIKTGTGRVDGTDEADLFYLGAGNQTVAGGLGPDNYIVGKNFGKDVIDDVEPPLSGSPDMLRFAQYKASQLNFTRAGDDLVIKVNGSTTDELRIVGQFAEQRSAPGVGQIDPDRGIVEIVFADGTVWDRLDIAKATSRYTTGNDRIQGTNSIDYLEGGLGNDTLLGGGDGDVYTYTAGKDVISDNLSYFYKDAPDVVVFGPGLTLDNATFIRTGGSSDLIIRFDSSNQLTVTGQFNAADTGVLGLYWENRIEEFVFSDGSSIYWDGVIKKLLVEAKTTGNDTIYGFYGEDRLDGGAGNDYLSGGNDSDTYVFGLGYGKDVIEEGRSIILSSNEDTVEFLAGVNPAEVGIKRIINKDTDNSDIVTNDLLITLKDGSTLTIKDQFGLVNTGVFGVVDFNRVEYFTFADGTYWNADQVRDRVLKQTFTTGNDTIYGFDVTNETIVGGKGNDTMEGRGGDDTYLHAQGDGKDVIIENMYQGADALTFTGSGLTSANARLSRVADSNSVTISFTGLTDSVVLTDQFATNFFGSSWVGVETIKFSDGAVWNTDMLRTKLIAASQTSGNDLIYGFDLNDTIIGGLGNDTMNAKGGDDLYIHKQGDGKDVINEGMYLGEDVLTFTGSGLTSANARLSRVADSETVTISFNGLADSVVLTEQFATNFFGSSWVGVETIKFSDGAVWNTDIIRSKLIVASQTTGNDLIYGFNLDDTIIGGLGNDTINGGGGDDSYVHAQGDGKDVINEIMFSGTDKLTFTGSKLTSANAKVSRIGDSDTLAISFAGVTDSVQLTDQGGSRDVGVETILFSDKITWTAESLRATWVATAATTGNDTIYGFHVSQDTITGGLGNDTMNGMGNDDTYIFRQGDGKDTIIETLLAGNDTLTLTGAALTSASLIVTKGQNNDLLLSFKGLNDSITLADQLSTSRQEGIETLRLSDGTILTADDLLTRVATSKNLTGTTGNDTLTGTLTTDTLSGGTGNDTLIGGYAADRLDGGAGIDTASYATSYAAVSIDLNRTTAQAGGDAAGDILLNIENVIGSNYHDNVASSSIANRIDGGAGTDTVSYASSTAAVNVSLARTTQSGGHAAGDVLVSIENITGSAHHDALAGNGGANTLLGGNGNDTLTGGAGADRLDGGAGTDTVSYASSASAVVVNLNLTTAQKGGDAAGDILLNIERVTGSAGNDSIIGNASANLFNGAAGNDTLLGGDGNDTILGGAGSDYIDGGAGIDTLSYSSSATWVSSDLGLNSHWNGDAAWDNVHNVENLIGSGYNDFLTGNTGNNNIAGGAGNDSVTGGAGNDTLDGGTGNDTLLGGDGNDTILGGAGSDYIDGGAGIDTISYASSAQWVNVDLGGNNHWNGDAAWDNVRNVEHIIGSNHNDQLVGNASANAILGGNGDDLITGLAGADTLTGGAGNDIFVYRAVSDSAGTAVDRITDFMLDSDRIDVRGLGYSSIVKGAASGGVLGFAYNSTDNLTTVSSAAGLKITLVGNLALDQGDFLFA